MPPVAIYMCAIGSLYTEAKWDGTGAGQGKTGTIFATQPVARMEKL